MGKTDQVKLTFESSLSKIFFLMLGLVSISLVLPIRLNSMAIGLLGLVWLMTQPWKSLKKFKDNTIAFLLMGFYGLYVIGLLYSANIDHGVKELEYKLAFILLPLFIITGPSLARRHFQVLLRLYAWSVLGLCLAAIGISLFKSSFGGEQSLISLLTYRELSTPVGFDPIYMALYIIMAFLIIIEEKVLGLDFRSPSCVPLLVWIQLTVLFLSLIFLSSRMEILVFFTALGLLMLLWGRATGKWMKPILIGLLVPLLSLALISVNDVNKERFTEMVDLETDYTENKWGGRSIRIEKWKNALECATASPIIGVGSGDTMDELMKVYKLNEFYLAIDNYFNPHNQYLQLLITFGVIGLIYFLFLLFSLVRLAWSRSDWLLLLFIIVMALSIVTESMLERQKGAVFFVFFAMLLSARALTSPSELQDN